MRNKLIPALIATSLLSNPLSAQYKQQVINLDSGWNAVFLEVEPVNRNLDALLNGKNINSVWKWNGEFESIEFFEDADDLLLDDPEWLVWLPDRPGTENITVRDLYALQGGSTYLINSDGFETLTITGKPTLRDQNWLSNSFNLVGFCFDPMNVPTYSEFFGNASSIYNPDNGDPSVVQPAYQMMPDGNWAQMSAGDLLTCGEAYWIYSSGNTDFQGPGKPTTEQQNELVFGRTIQEQVLSLNNTTESPITYTINLNEGLTPPEGEPLNAGAVPLMVYAQDQYSTQPEVLNKIGFELLTDGMTFEVASGERRNLRIAVDRTQFAEPSFGVEDMDKEFSYQSIISVCSDMGTMNDIAVSAAAMTGNMVRDITNNPYAGLWVGTAGIHSVSHAESKFDSTLPLPIKEPANPGEDPPEVAFLRLILHVDTDGDVRFLREVTQMYDPKDEGIPEDGGDFVLITDNSLLDNFSGPTLVDNQNFGRRISTVAYAWDRDLDDASHPNTLLETNGSFFDGDDQTIDMVRFDIALSPGSPPAANEPTPRNLNPFYHQYHPDHDNREEPSSGVQGAILPIVQSEAPLTTRVIRLIFEDIEETKLTIPGYGDQRISGTYLEAVGGLHANDIYTEGNFSLSRVSITKELNNGGMK